MTDVVDKSRSEEARGNGLLPIFAIVVVDTAGAGLILPLLPFYARHFGATPLDDRFSIGKLCHLRVFRWADLGKRL
ncbi:hypothetical protein QFZ34_000348 [Phyllobacterium ifriqiyense]|uniref:MFS transporter n=1 Tax=Phyllobacterium ifriqiyense TaxID=314238 RepID=A0ABU0S3H2_9HYPH|nr:hypothetical protein [Phyllobacterium ifriqiyense]MDQ0995171.1 hypothetical protein [Phyllobacterium ifriqiyense]